MVERELAQIPVILWHPDGKRLAVQGEVLPLLEVKTGSDVSESIKKQWNMDAWTLDDAGISFGLMGTPRLRALSEELPPHLGWAVKDIPALLCEQVWQRPDWLECLKERLAWAGMTVLGTTSLYSNDLVSIVRVQTPDAEAFLKTSTTPQEARFTEYVTANFPALCPPLLSSNADEHWQVTASGGELLDSVGELKAWQQAIVRLTEFQQSADAAALAGLGAPVYPLREMHERVQAFLNDTAVLKAWKLEDEKIQALQAARPRIKRTFQQLAELNLPDLPAHGDAHPRNALHGENGSVWFDWSETLSAAHPFMDWGWFLAFALHPAREKLPIRQSHADLETELMNTILHAFNLTERQMPLLSAAIPLAYLHRAVVYNEKFRDWQGNIPDWRPNYVPYYLRQAVREWPRLSP